MSTAETIDARRNAIITDAARVLIGIVRMAEKDEGRETAKAELLLEVELTAGGIEQWTITIERTGEQP